MHAAFKKLTDNSSTLFKRALYLHTDDRVNHFFCCNIVEKDSGGKSEYGSSLEYLQQSPGSLADIAVPGVSCGQLPSTSQVLWGVGLDFPCQIVEKKEEEFWLGQTTVYTAQNVCDG